MFQNNSIFPRLSGLPLAGKAMSISATRPRRKPTLSRSELRRLIADMVD